MESKYISTIIIFLIISMLIISYSAGYSIGKNNTLKQIKNSEIQSYNIGYSIGKNETLKQIKIIESQSIELCGDILQNLSGDAYCFNLTHQYAINNPKKFEEIINSTSKLVE
jgi:hypothetical protein